MSILLAFTVNDKRFVPVADAANLVGVSLARVYQLTRTKRIASYKVGRKPKITYVCLTDLQATPRRDTGWLKKPRAVEHKIARWLAQHPDQRAELRNANELYIRLTQAGVSVPRSSVYKYFDGLVGAAPATPSLPPPVAIPDGLLLAEDIAEALNITVGVIKIWVRTRQVEGKEIGGKLYVESASLKAFYAGKG